MTATTKLILINLLSVHPIFLYERTIDRVLDGQGSPAATSVRVYQSSRLPRLPELRNSQRRCSRNVQNIDSRFENLREVQI